MSAASLDHLLPVAPRPAEGERLASWLTRLAALYDAPVGFLLAHCGLAGADPFALERGLGAGEGALLAAPTGMSLDAIEATTFRELSPSAHGMIARFDRAFCLLCARDPAVKRKDAALPWGFWCATHGLRRRPLAGETIEASFGGALAGLDRLARLGARRLADWAAGRDGLTITHMNGAHHASLERLHHFGTAAGDDLAGRCGNDVDATDNRPDKSDTEQNDDRVDSCPPKRRWRRLDNFEGGRQERHFLAVATLLARSERNNAAFSGHLGSRPAINRVRRSARRS